MKAKDQILAAALAAATDSVIAELARLREERDVLLLKNASQREELIELRKLKAR